jgi:hypothetical protein
VGARLSSGQPLGARTPLRKTGSSVPAPHRGRFTRVWPSTWRRSGGDRTHSPRRLAFGATVTSGVTDQAVCAAAFRSTEEATIFAAECRVAAKGAATGDGMPVIEDRPCPCKPRVVPIPAPLLSFVLGGRVAGAASTPQRAEASSCVVARHAVSVAGKAGSRCRGACKAGNALVIADPRERSLAWRF